MLGIDNAGKEETDHDLNMAVEQLQQEEQEVLEPLAAAGPDARIIKVVVSTTGCSSLKMQWACLTAS